MSLDVDLDQIEPGETTLGGEGIEAAQRDPQSVMAGTSGADPRGAGVDARRGHDRHGKLRDAVVVADRAAENFGMAQGIGGERRFECGGAVRRRLDREHPPPRSDLSGERHGPFPEIGADIDDDRTGLQKPEHRHMYMWRVEQRMPPPRVERARHIDEIAGAMQRKAAGPFPFEPREQTLFAPPPNKPRARGFRLTRRPQLPKRLEQRHHGPQIAGLLSEMSDDHVRSNGACRRRHRRQWRDRARHGAGLAEAGATVVIAARNVEKAEAALAALGDRSMFIPLDVADENSCRAVIEQTVDRFGRLDVLVNNAGTSIRKPPEAYTAAEWHAVLDTNLTGAFLCSQAAHPVMKRSGGGKIINIGSMFALFGSAYAAPYAASKGALVQMTKSLAAAWAEDNIQVNAVLPGWIDTELTRDAREQVAGLHERVLARTPAGRWGVPEDLAGIAVFLASPASDFVTGAAIPVDGGFSAMG